MSQKEIQPHQLLRKCSCSQIVHFYDNYCRNCGQNIKLNEQDIKYLCFHISTNIGQHVKDFIPNVSMCRL